MNYFEDNVEHIRGIINELYSCIDDIGAHTDLAEVVTSICSQLKDAVDEYEKQVKE